MIFFFLQLSFSRRFCALFSHWLNGYTWYPCVVKTSASLSPDRNKHDALPDATGIWQDEWNNTSADQSCIETYLCFKIVTFILI